MRGVLLTILCYCMLQVYYQKKKKKIGEDELAKFAHLFNKVFL